MDCNKNKSFLLRGKEVEKKLAESLSNIKFATDEEDINDHVDLKQEITFDVKGLRKTRRSDNTVNENIHYVEFRNVNGDDGWLYGKADFIVFETICYWVVVERTVLIEFVQEKCKEKIWTESPEPYKLYKRTSRPKECVTLVHSLDLCFLAERIIKK